MHIPKGIILFKMHEVEQMNRIKDLREEYKISQSQLAEKIGVAQGTICKYENGRQKISGDALVSLCELFECSAAYLRGESDVRKIMPTESDGHLPEITQKLLGAIPNLDIDEQQLMWNLIQTIESKRGEGQ